MPKRIHGFNSGILRNAGLKKPAQGGLVIDSAMAVFVSKSDAMRKAGISEKAAFRIIKC